MIKYLIVAIIILISSIGHSTTVPQIRITKLYQQADVVAIVRIESGETINGTNFPCGAKYQGKVINSLKNSKVNQLIEFGYYFGHGIGNEYIVFLNKKHNVYSPLASTNSGLMDSQAQFDRECYSKHPELVVMHSGFGMRELQYHGESKSNYAFLIPTNYLSLPKDTEYTEPKKSECDTFDECKWVDKEAMLILLPNSSDKLK